MAVRCLQGWHLRSHCLLRVSGPESLLSSNWTSVRTINKLDASAGILADKDAAYTLYYIHRIPPSVIHCTTLRILSHLANRDFMVRIGISTHYTFRPS